MCVISHSSLSIIWKYIIVSTLGNGHSPVMCVKSHSSVIVIWRDTRAYTVGSGHTAVIFVINHSIVRVIWWHINASIMGSGHFAVMCVISHSIIRVIWWHINASIVGSGRTAVMCVISHSSLGLIWRHINASIARTGHYDMMCNKSFTRPSYLKTQRTHSGRQIFAVVCVMSFVSHGPLKILNTTILGSGHLSVMFNNSFSRKCNLYAHHPRHNMEQPFGVSHSVISVLWRHISVYKMGNSHFTMWTVI
jgi:hypothetical protein